jgi:hypothetical protein
MPRQRKHPEGTTPSQRVASAQAVIIAHGGARKHFLLSADAVRALETIKAVTGETQTAIVERLLIAEARKLKRKGKP